MLQFYYDFLDFHCDRKDFEYLQMDTDSAYFAISEKKIDDIVTKNRSIFLENISNKCDVDRLDPKNCFLSRICCSKHNKFDEREPGLFKLEFSGDKFIGLSSKTYMVKGKGEIKYSAKGVCKNNLQSVDTVFQKVINEKGSHEITNQGIQLKNNKICSYSQKKIGFTYFYCKRKILEDGINTVPLDITLSPFSNSGNEEKTDELEPLEILCSLF